MNPNYPYQYYYPQPQVQPRDMVPHVAAWPSVALAVIAITTALTARMFHYPTTIALGMATLIAAVAGIVICARRASPLLWAAAGAAAIGLLVLVLGFVAMNEFATAWSQIQDALNDLSNLFGANI